jgi:hypothetical protein
MSTLSKTTMKFALLSAVVLSFCLVGYKKGHNLCHGSHVVYIEVSIPETYNYVPAV